MLFRDCLGRGGAHRRPHPGHSAHGRVCPSLWRISENAIVRYRHQGVFKQTNKQNTPKEAAKISTETLIAISWNKFWKANSLRVALEIDCISLLSGRRHRLLLFSTLFLQASQVHWLTQWCLPGQMHIPQSAVLPPVRKQRQDEKRDRPMCVFTLYGSQGYRLISTNCFSNSGCGQY